MGQPSSLPLSGTMACQEPVGYETASLRREWRKLRSQSIPHDCNGVILGFRANPIGTIHTNSPGLSWGWLGFSAPSGFQKICEKSGLGICRTLQFGTSRRFGFNGEGCDPRPRPYRQIPARSLSDGLGYLHSNRASKSDRLLGGFLIRVPEALTRGYSVAKELFEFLELGKSSVLFARPHENSVNPHLEETAGLGNKSQFADLLVEGYEKLLRRPCRPHEPATLSAVADFDSIVS